MIKSLKFLKTNFYALYWLMIIYIGVKNFKNPKDYRYAILLDPRKWRH